MAPQPAVVTNTLTSNGQLKTKQDSQIKVLAYNTFQNRTTAYPQILFFIINNLEQEHPFEHKR